MPKFISIEQLHDHFKKLAADELILDVRTPGEYAAGHVPGSRNISYENVASHADELKKYKTLYLYCLSGGRVRAAAHDLMHAGLQSLMLVGDGGMPDWVERGYEVER